MASQISINAAQFSDEHLDPSVAISHKHKNKNKITPHIFYKIPVYTLFNFANCTVVTVVSI